MQHEGSVAFGLAMPRIKGKLETRRADAARKHAACNIVSASLCPGDTRGGGAPWVPQRRECLTLCVSDQWLFGLQARSAFKVPGESAARLVAGRAMHAQRRATRGAPPVPGDRRLAHRRAFCAARRPAHGPQGTEGAACRLLGQPGSPGPMVRLLLRSQHRCRAGWPARGPAPRRGGSARNSRGCGSAFRAPRSGRTPPATRPASP